MAKRDDTVEHAMQELQQAIAAVDAHVKADLLLSAAEYAKLRADVETAKARMEQMLKRIDAQRPTNVS